MSTCTGNFAKSVLRNCHDLAPTHFGDIYRAFSKGLRDTEVRSAWRELTKDIIAVVSRCMDKVGAYEGDKNRWAMKLRDNELTIIYK